MANLKHPHTRVHALLRWPLRTYKWLASFVGLGLVGHLVQLLFANGLSGFLPAARSQLAALLALVTAQPIGSAVVAAVLLVLFLLSVRADQAYAQEVASQYVGPLSPQPEGPPDDVWLLYPP